MIRSRLCAQIQRLSLNELNSSRDVHTSSSYRAQKLVQLEGQIIARKKKNIEKEIRKHEKHGEKELRPIEENELPVTVIRELKQGLRLREIEPLTEEQKEHDYLLLKKYAKFCAEQAKQDKNLYLRAQKAQDKALQELEKENYELYLKAIEPDDALLGSTFQGPMHTPPIPDYLALDGRYTDETNYFTNMDSLTDLVLHFKETAKLGRRARAKAMEKS